MKREENLTRLENFKENDISSSDYLVYLSFHRELKTAIQKFAKGRLVDIGCGNKPYEIWSHGKISQYIGCDVIQSSSNKVDILCEANNIPLESKSFDTILSTQAIEHIEDYQGMIDEAFRLLTSGGYFILSGPFYWYLHEEPFDFYRFTKHGFKYILEKSGFEVIQTSPNGGAWATLGLMINHTFGFKNSNANTLIRGIKYLFRKMNIHILVNRIFSYLDRKDYNTINTINYVIIARKK